MANSNEPIVSNRSVRSGDVWPALPGQGVFFFNVPALDGVLGGAYYIKNLPPDPPAYMPNNKYRDTLFAITPNIEGMWANACAIASGKVSFRDYDFQGPDAQIKRMWNIFDNCDNGNGFISYLPRMFRDFVTTGNGTWTEIVRVKDDPAAEIITFNQLDSLRCWRTGDPQSPIYYYDLHGKYHEMKWYQVFNITDLPTPRAGFYNSGICSAERAYRHVRLLAALNIYTDEKLTGGGYNEIEIVNGMTADQLKTAIAESDNDANQKGVVYYKGKIIIPIYTDTPIAGHKIQLKGLPEGFDKEKIEEEVHLVYSKALGIVPQDLDPKLMARGAMGVGAQSKTLDDNQAGYGQGWFDKMLTHRLNQLVVSSRSTFSFITRDLRDQQAEATVKLTRAQERQARILSGEIDTAKAQQIAYEAGDLPLDLVDTYEQPDQASIDDTEKPEQQLAEGGEGESIAVKAALDNLANAINIARKEIRVHA